MSRRILALAFLTAWWPLIDASPANASTWMTWGFGTIEMPEKKVPDVVGMKWSAGTAELAWEGFDFDLEIDWDCPPDKMGKITRQSPVGGSIEPKGSVVTVWYMPSGKASATQPATNKVQWFRTGPIIASNDTEGRMPRLMSVSGNSLTYKTESEGKDYSNTLTWSEPPETVQEDEVIKLTISSDSQQGPANVGGWWNLRGHNEKSFTGQTTAGSDKNWRRDGSSPHSAKCSFKFDPSRDKAMIQLSAGHDPAPDTWVLVTYNYTRRPVEKSPIGDKDEDIDKQKRVLAMSPEEFLKDKEAWQILYDMAVKMRDWQKAFAEKRIKESGIETRDGMVVSKLKRDKLDEFAHGVYAKCKRNKYDQIGRMDDIARGRFNMRSREELEKVARALIDNPGEMNVIQIEAPRRKQPDGGYGYPRYHVIMQDPQTGLRYEWQMGTQATSTLYETEGVPIPKNVTLPEGMRTDLHDIEYDILRGISKNDKELAKEVNLEAVHNAVDAVSSKTYLEGDDFPDMDSSLKKLQQLVGEVLQKVVDIKGPDYLKRYYH